MSGTRKLEIDLSKLLRCTPETESIVRDMFRDAVGFTLAVEREGDSCGLIINTMSTQAIAATIVNLMRKCPELGHMVELFKMTNGSKPTSIGPVISPISDDECAGCTITDCPYFPDREFPSDLEKFK